ncbi:hypothetical protein C8J56DRAFT_799842, partial [Mycena floridula]
EELPAHVYLRSVHNISIKRSWLRLYLDFSDNAVLCFENGIAAGIYNPEDQISSTLFFYLYQRLSIDYALVHFVNGYGLGS